MVTNQQGVAKELMTEEDLQFIHSEMLKEVRKYGGRIHAIYAATEPIASDTKQMRKPGIGMAKRAKKDFPEIDFTKSVIVGDSASDMQFGRNTGMITVFIGDRNKLSDENQNLVDIHCESLAEFSSSLAH